MCLLFTLKIKQMFTVPIGNWLKDKLKDMVSDLLFSEGSTQRGLFNNEYVKDLYKSHCRNK